MRETRVRIQQHGFRCRSMIVVSTLLDGEAVTADDLAELYRARWNAEVDLRSLKQTMQMDILRCKTPELVRREHLDSHSGLQSHPHHNRSSGHQTRHRAKSNQL